MITLAIPADVEIGHALFRDMEEPYHYVRVAKGDVLHWQAHAARKRSLFAESDVVLGF